MVAKTSPLFRRKYNGSQYTMLKMNIRGWYQFCSGGLIVGVGGNKNSYFQKDYLDEQRLLAMDHELVQAAADVHRWNEYRKKDPQRHWDALKECNQTYGVTHFGVPLDVAYDILLYKIFVKARDGIGGHDMWGHNKYPSQTFAIADRYDKSDNQMSCWGLQNHIMKLSKRKGKRKFVQYAQLPELVDGAHGGKCRGALFSFTNHYNAATYFDEVTDRLEAHWNWIVRRLNSLQKVEKLKLKGGDALLQEQLINW